MRVLLSAALIARNEAQFLPACLESLAGVADEVIVVDTGSTDTTPDIAREFGARLLRHRWRGNFADARNESLDAARGDWVLYIDADERLVDGDRRMVETLLNGAGEIAFRVLLRPIVNATPYREYRLWRNDRRIRFVGIIHETVVPAIHHAADADALPISDCELLLEHVGYEGTQKHKHRRNLPLLRMELEQDPFNLFKRHHLARVLKGLGEDGEAAEVLADAMEVARRRPADPLGVLVFTDAIRWRRERQEDVTELLDEARIRYPSNKVLWWLEANVHLSGGRYDEALELLDQLIRTNLASLPGEGPAYDQRMFREFAHEARGLCLFRLGRYQEAAEAYERAMQLDPNNLKYRLTRQVALGRARNDPP